jgi:hypothetical protein
MAHLLSVSLAAEFCRHRAVLCFKRKRCSIASRHPSLPISAAKPEGGGAGRLGGVSMDRWIGPPSCSNRHVDILQQGLVNMLYNGSIWKTQMPRCNMLCYYYPILCSCILRISLSDITDAAVRNWQQTDRSIPHLPALWSPSVGLENIRDK